MKLTDKTAIENLIYRYARLVDTAAYEELGAMFVRGHITSNKRAPDDAMESALRGSTAVSNFYSTTNKTYSTGGAQTHHVVTNLEFEHWTEGAVIVHSCFTVFQGTTALPLQPIVCGRYRDELRCTDGIWHYHSKHIEVTLVGNITNHLNIDL